MTDNSHIALQRTRSALETLVEDTRKQSNNFIKSPIPSETALFALTRILLFKLFVDFGLTNWPSQKQIDYSSVNQEIERVLRENYGLTNSRKSWLLSGENDHTWYYPNNEILKNVIEKFSRFDLNEIDIDLMGTLYEEQIGRMNRKNKGQFYTSPEIVSFIWNRVGLKTSFDFFDCRNGKPWRIFDPCTGSGSFLIEAARRLKTRLHHISGDLIDIRNAFGTLCGSEVNSFPHYLAQMNLLIQLTPIMKKLNQHNRHHAKGFAIPIINCNALSLYNQNQKFDYVCSNPPFIGEKGNKTLFRSTIKKYPYWKQYYQGKMDYLYWFIILGLSSLKEGGKLGFITTSYWPTADGASKLRRYILDHALICEIIDFGETPIFGDALGQHNMIFVMERSNNPLKRAANQIKTARVKKGKPKLKSLLNHLEEHIDRASYSDEFIDVFTSSTVQGDLTEKTWNLFRSDKTSKTLNTITENSMPLGNLCQVTQGIITGADKVTRRNISLLPAKFIAKQKIKLGDGIFVLNEEELKSLKLNSREMRLLKPLIKNSDIKRYSTSSTKPQFLIYTTRETDIDSCPKIKAHLEKFRPILENKRECGEGRLPWVSLHWPRDIDTFTNEKIITPNRAQQNTFALSQSPLYAMSDIFFIAGRNQKESLSYILAILNSSLIEFWFSCTQKSKGKIREYVGTPLSKVPIRRIDFTKSSEIVIHDQLISLVREIAVADPEAQVALQHEIDIIVLRLYGLKSIDIML